MRFLNFFTIFLILSGLWSAYLAWRLVGNIRTRRLFTFFVALAFFAILSMTPVSIILDRAGVDGVGMVIIRWVGALGLGYLSFLFVFVVFRDMVAVATSLAAAVARWIPRETGLQDCAAPTVDEERRRFLVRGLSYGMFGGAFMVTGYGVSQARQIPSIKEVDIAISRLPSALEGFRIVQITDLHIGPTLGRSFVEGVVDVVNTLDAGVVALTGDLVDGSVEQLSGAVAPLSKVMSRYGNFFVTGNHEYYSGVLPWLEKVGSLGFTVLLNDHRVVKPAGETLVVAGVTDLRGGYFFDEHQPDPRAALAGAPKGGISVLLAHQPKAVVDAAAVGFDLQLSGHTHGGQFFPWNLCVGFFQPYVAGLYMVEGTRLYVSRGTGYWGPPVRVGSPSEITLIRLTSLQA